MVAVNDITGDKIKTGANSQKYVDNFGNIDWSKPKVDKEVASKEISKKESK